MQINISVVAERVLSDRSSERGRGRNIDFVARTEASTSDLHVHVLPGHSHVDCRPGRARLQRVHAQTKSIRGDDQQQ